jgi:WD40 repeat protein
MNSKIFTVSFLISIACFLLFIGTINAQPPAQPILRLEGGMHNNSIKRISIDRGNRFLVTGGYDKTVRVWDLLSGQMTRILRPPIGEGHEGKIYALAISPDGNTIAAGGWTGYSWNKKSSIYLFDRESGKLKKSVGNLTGLVHFLTYSPDGRFLGAGFDSRGSVRIFETNEYQTVGSDLDNSQDIINCVDFHPNGNRLVTGDRSGVLRIYDVEPDGKLRRIAANRIKEGNSIFTVRFSPDGERIATGFVKLKSAGVFSASDLSLLYVPDPKEIYYGDFTAVAWSADGHKLFGGGYPYNKGRGSVIRTWKNEGRGSYKETSVSTSTIFQILPLQKGGLVYCSARDWGILDEDGICLRLWKRSVFSVYNK